MQRLGKLTDDFERCSEQRTHLVFRSSPSVVTINGTACRIKVREAPEPSDV